MLRYRSVAFVAICLAIGAISSFASAGQLMGHMPVVVSADFDAQEIPFGDDLVAVESLDLTAGTPIPVGEDVTFVSRDGSIIILVKERVGLFGFTKRWFDTSGLNITFDDPGYRDPRSPQDGDVGIIDEWIDANSDGAKDGLVVRELHEWDAYDLAILRLGKQFSHELSQRRLVYLESGSNVVLSVTSNGKPLKAGPWGNTYEAPPGEDDFVRMTVTFVSHGKLNTQEAGAWFGTIADLNDPERSIKSFTQISPAAIWALLCGMAPTWVPQDEVGVVPEYACVAANHPGMVGYMQAMGYKQLPPSGTDANDVFVGLTGQEQLGGVCWTSLPQGKELAPGITVTTHWEHSPLGDTVPVLVTHKEDGSVAGQTLAWNSRIIIVPARTDHLAQTERVFQVLRWRWNEAIVQEGQTAYKEPPTLKTTAPALK